jgi:hypothetical protein
LNERYQVDTKFQNDPIPSRAQSEREEPKDRLQVKRENKEQSQRKRQGNQPMPEHFTSPQISILGSCQILPSVEKPKKSKS